MATSRTDDLLRPGVRNVGSSPNSVGPTAAGPPSPRRDTARDPDRRWIAVPALVAGLLATLAAWQAVASHERSNVRLATKLAAEAVRHTVETDMEWQIVGLDRLAILWEAAVPAQELWTKNAELYMQHRRGCVAVEWLTANGAQRVVVTEEGTTRALAFAGRPEALLKAVSKARAAMISAPARVSDGSRQWAIAYPVYAQNQPRGFVVAFFDVEQSLKRILGDLTNLGFFLGVSQPDQPEHVLPGTSREHEPEWGVVADVALPGTTWQLHVWPSPAVVNEIGSSLPELVLGVGVLFSVLLAASWYFAAAAAVSHARTTRANEALQREVTVREGAQEALGRARAELELRIDRRTAELAATNALLLKEVADHRQAEETLRDLTGRLFQSQDQERRRLARELHDGVVQNLVALAMDLGLVRDALPAADAASHELVNECARLAEQCSGDLRTISYLLHPPYFDELGLTAALRDFVHGFAARSGIEVTLDIDPTLGRLGHEMELAIYRVVQEALSNVHRHAASRTARIALERRGDCVQLEVADAGRGMPPELLARGVTKLAGVGIAGMRERVRLLGGRLQIQSGDGGTSIQAVLPLPVPAGAGA